jgi:hypothetical protein
VDVFSTHVDADCRVKERPERKWRRKRFTTLNSLPIVRKLRIARCYSALSNIVLYAPVIRSYDRIYALGIKP